MKVVIGGVRGTSCVARPNYMKYGGETTAVMIEGRDGERVLIDAGTGIRDLGLRIEKAGLPQSLLLLVTHYHLDHLIGLPSFGLLYNEACLVQVASARREGHRVEKVLKQVMAQPYWPVQIEDLRSVSFLDWPEESGKKPFRFGGLEVRWCPIHHPGGCTAYRIDEPATGRGMVFATDVEWPAATAAERSTFEALCSNPRPADLLVFDGQFTRKTYSRFKGWGHSAWEDAVEVAKAVKARLLLITHHAPQNDDGRMSALEKEIGQASQEAKLARDGMEIVL